jgi:nanoRNase/pAp phosphatase (c-di-AMP/oligoRNAs hydrolase)
VKSALAKSFLTGTSAFVIHGNADPDALGSAYALSTVFSGSIVAPGGLDRASKILAQKFSISVLDDFDEVNIDRVVVLDTSGPEQLGKLKYLGEDEKVIVIDHHTKNAAWTAKTYYCDEKKKSCCEIVYEIVKASGKKLSRNAALALLSGMLTDTGHFRYGNAVTLETFAEILRHYEIDMHEALSVIEGETELSERISQLKGAQRLRYIRAEKFIIATSFGSAFEASVGKSLINLGADVAFVGSQRGVHFRISARASPEVVDLGLHLGKLLEGVGNETSSGGGGHPGAAGLSGQGDVRRILDLCVHRTKKALRSLLPAEH